MKVLGARLKEFYNEVPDGYCFELDDEYQDLSLEHLDPQLSYQIQGLGWITHQEGPVSPWIGNDILTIATVYKRWEKMKTTTIIAVRVPVEQAEAVKAAISQIAGVKFIR